MIYSCVAQTVVCFCGPFKGEPLHSGHLAQLWWSACSQNHWHSSSINQKCICCPHWDSLQHWGETVYKASVFLPQSSTPVWRQYFPLKICKFNYSLSSTGIAMKELWWLPFNYFWLDLWCKCQQNRAQYNPKGYPEWPQRSWKGEEFWGVSVIPVCFGMWHKVDFFFNPLVAVSTNEAKYNLNWFNEVLQVLEVLTENEVV